LWNIFGTHSATYRQKLASDLSNLEVANWGLKSKTLLNINYRLYPVWGRTKARVPLAPCQILLLLCWVFNFVVVMLSVTFSFGYAECHILLWLCWVSHFAGVLLSVAFCYCYAVCINFLLLCWVSHFLLLYWVLLFVLLCWVLNFFNVMLSVAFCCGYAKCCILLLICWVLHFLIVMLCV